MRAARMLSHCNWLSDIIATISSSFPQFPFEVRRVMTIQLPAAGQGGDAPALSEPLFEDTAVLPSRTATERNAALLQRLRPRLAAQWPGWWVAIHQGHLVGPAEDLRSLMSLLRDQFGDPTAAAFTYLGGSGGADASHTLRRAS